MKETNLEVTCQKCNRAFRLFSDDGNGDTTICWNYCPHCGERNDIWIRFLPKREEKYVPIGLGAIEAYKLANALQSVANGSTVKVQG